MTAGLSVASCISWHIVSRAIWQLKATFASSQSCRKREILPPSPHNPKTCNASLHALPSREPLEDTSLTSINYFLGTRHLVVFRTQQ